MKKIRLYFFDHFWVQCLSIFLLGVAVFGFLHYNYAFADPDSFYHAKMGQILLERGAIKQLPQLAFTSLSNSFVDHHFLYHLLLVPFVKVFPALMGLKVATVIFSSLTILSIFFLLKKLEVPGAYWFSLFLLTINPFIFRLGLGKAQGLALAFLFFIIYLIIQRKYLSLVLTSALFVWLYGGWPLLVVVGVVYGITNWFWTLSHRKRILFWVKKLKTSSQNFKLIFSITLGIVAGIFFSPYFPQNILFYYQQSFKIAVLNYQYIIDVGAEWYPYQIGSLVMATAPFFVLLAVAGIIFIKKLDKQSVNSWFFLVITLLFLFLTLKSRRYVEYLIPFGLVFSAVSWKSYFEEFNKTLVARRFKKLFFIALALLIFPAAFFDIAQVKASYDQGLSFDKFYESARYLKNNTPEKSLVFHSDWDEFPELFFNNDHNYYIVGLDPTFMYDYDSQLYFKWLRITQGEDAEKLYQTIVELFGASYVFVDKYQNSAFDQNLENNIFFEKVFEGPEANIYRAVK